MNCTVAVSVTMMPEVTAVTKLPAEVTDSVVIASALTVSITPPDVLAVGGVSVKCRNDVLPNWK